VLGNDQRVRADVRAASRRAHTNAQASLDRLRGEPRRDVHALATAEGVFANANRFLRAAMALEAMRQNAPVVSPEPIVVRFVEQVDTTLQKLGVALRSGTPAADTGLRTLQSELQRSLESITSEEERLRAIAWIEGSDRITNTLNTLAHLLAGRERTSA
jgi:hypothetical protein